MNSIKNYISSPIEALAEDKKRLAEAEFEAMKDPLVLGGKSLAYLMSLIGNTAGSSMGVDMSGINSVGASIMPLIDMIADVGGTVGSGNVIAEGGEIIETPDGTIAKIKGKSHEKGGVPLNLEEGTKVYSKRTKVFSDTKPPETMAQRKDKREKRLSSLSQLYEKTPDIFSEGALGREEEKSKIENEFDDVMQDKMQTDRMKESFMNDFFQFMSSGGTVGDPEKMFFKEIPYELKKQLIEDYQKTLGRIVLKPDELPKYNEYDIDSKFKELFNNDERFRNRVYLNGIDPTQTNFYKGYGKKPEYTPISKSLKKSYIEGQQFINRMDPTNQFDKLNYQGEVIGDPKKYFGKKFLEGDGNEKKMMDVLKEISKKTGKPIDLNDERTRRSLQVEAGLTGSPGTPTAPDGTFGQNSLDYLTQYAKNLKQQPLMDESKFVSAKSLLEMDKTGKKINTFKSKIDDKVDIIDYEKKSRIAGTKEYETAQKFVSKEHAKTSLTDKLKKLNFNKAGDIASYAGDLISTFAPYYMAKKAAAETPVPYNPFKGVADEANLNYEKALATLDDTKAQYEKVLNLQANSARRGFRNRVGSSNVLNALDTSSELNKNLAKSYSDYSSQVANLFGQRANTMLQAKVYEGEGDRWVQDTVAANIDNKNSTLSEAYSYMGQGLQELGKDINTSKYNKEYMKVLNEFSPYIEYNLDKGKMENKTTDDNDKDPMNLMNLFISFLEKNKP